jgi:hypothetical protein
LEKIPRYPLYYLKHFIYFISYIITITFYIFDNTLILLIRPFNTTVRQLKNQSYRINFNRQILTYTYIYVIFYYIRVLFQPVVQVVLCTVKNSRTIGNSVQDSQLFSWGTLLWSFDLSFPVIFLLSRSFPVINQDK